MTLAALSNEYHSDLFIGGTWVKAHSQDRIQLVNPATELVWGEVPNARSTDVDSAVSAATRAFESGVWSRIDAAKRAEFINRFADELAARGEQMAAIISSENGSPIAETSAAASHSAGILRYYAGLADYLSAEDRRPFVGTNRFTQVYKEPRGVCLLIAPWNFPLTLVMVKLAPALIAGCTVVIKPAAETPLDLRVLIDAAQAAGIPAGVINLVTGDRETGALLVAHPGIQKVAFTGSTGAGRIIAEQCAKLLRPVTLELGGKSAAIVLADADINHFANSLSRTCLRNTGQTCYNSTRVLAPRSRYREVVEAMVETVANTKVGDPFDPATVYGPSASSSQRDRVANYIGIGVNEGAKIAIGGPGMPDGIERGYFVKPTIFTDVDNSMRIAQEEIFGPVLVVIPYDDEEDAIRIANDSAYGLGGSIFTSDPDHAEDVARRIETGSIGINFYGSNLAAPFGGWKDSGLGVEYGPEAIGAYVKLKSIHREN